VRGYARRMIRRHARLAATAALTLAVLAGCGDTTGRGVVDRRAAVSARLDAADLPGRWIGMPNGGTLSCPALASAVGAARGASDQFVSAGRSADDVVFLFHNALAAKVRMSAVLTAESRRCIGREIWDRSTAPIPSRMLTVARVGDDVQAARFTLPVGAQDFGDTLDVVVVRVGRAVLVVEVAGDAPALDAGQRDGVVAAAVRRLRAVQASR
jgi:hypothetical protein